MTSLVLLAGWMAVLGLQYGINESSCSSDPNVARGQAGGAAIGGLAGGLITDSLGGAAVGAAMGGLIGGEMKKH